MNAFNTVMNPTTLERAALENEKALKLAQDKARTLKLVRAKFPDAFMGQVEDGDREYLSKSVNKDTPGAKLQILFGGAGQASGRFWARYVVLIGKTKIYSAESDHLQNYQVKEFLNQFVKMPSGKEAVIKHIEELRIKK